MVNRYPRSVTVRNFCYFLGETSTAPRWIEYQGLESLDSVPLSCLRYWHESDDIFLIKEVKKMIMRRMLLASIEMEVST